MVRATDFFVIERHLYKMGIDEILCRYVLKFECTSILNEADGGVGGGHYVGRVTTQSITRVGLWWPRVHKDSKTFFKACDACQRTKKPLRRDEFPLNPQVSLQVFKEWEN